MKLAIKIILLFICICQITIANAGSENELFFYKTVQEALEEKIGDGKIEIEIEFNSKSKVKELSSSLADKIKTVKVSEIDQKRRMFNLIITFIDDKEDSLTGTYIPYIKIPVAARYIKLGEIITESDLREIKIPLDANQKQKILSFAETIGMQAKKFIAAQSMILKGDVATPPVIKNNDPVNLVYSSGAIYLKTSGIAMGVGAVGDMIKVKNATSGVVLLGEIIDKNTVQIGGEKK